MIGLMYKDFISTKSKFFLVLYVLQLVVAGLLRYMYADVVEAEMMISYAGSAAVCCMLMLIIFNMETSVLKTDDRKQTDYYLSTPVSKNKYVASKYVFLLCAFIITSIISIIEVVICKNSQFGKKVMDDVWKLLPILIGLCVGVCALELPFYFGLGTEGGAAFKTGLVFVLMFALIAYVLFGDLSVFKDFNILKILMKKGLLKKVQILTPIIGTGLYFFSYIISVFLFKRREKYI